MNPYLEGAQALESEIVANRRALHAFAETGFDLPQTLALVEERLRAYGLEPRRVGRAGIGCTLGKPGKTVLLRADMDALPMQEATGLPFAAQNGNCHACGHDCHTAMLLGAARLLKEREAGLNGTVKLMFQPAEEQLAGAKDMIDAGILENPRVDAAIALHVMAGNEYGASGTVHYAKGPLNFSGDALRIVIMGRNAHGASPEKGVDAINIAAHIVIALQEIIAREVPASDQAVVLVGTIKGGDTVNTLGGHAEMTVSLRAANETMRAYLKSRVKEIAENTARTFRGTAEVEFTYGIGPMSNDGNLSLEVGGYCEALLGAEKVFQISISAGSEDFTYVAQAVPSVMLYLGAGGVEEGYTHSMHHPAMVLNEKALPLGAALYAYCAEQYLQRR